MKNSRITKLVSVILTGVTVISSASQLETFAVRGQRKQEVSAKSEKKPKKLKKLSYNEKQWHDFNKRKLPGRLSKLEVTINGMYNSVVENKKIDNEKIKTIHDAVLAANANVSSVNTYSGEKRITFETRYNHSVPQQVDDRREYLLLIQKLNDDVDCDIKDIWNEVVGDLNEKIKVINHELIGLRVENMIDTDEEEEDDDEIIDLLGKRNRRMQEDE